MRGNCARHQQQQAVEQGMRGERGRESVCVCVCVYVIRQDELLMVMVAGVLWAAVG